MQASATIPKFKLNYLPLNTLRFQHVSAPTVSACGGFWGNASAYAEAVPNGGAMIMMREI